MNRVEVVTCRCSRTKALFGIRFEEVARGQWHATWAFLIRADVAGREGYTDSRIEGSFHLAAEYPGCPADCSRRDFVLCVNCDRLGCADEYADYYRCPWCDHGGSVGGSIEGLNSGKDR